VEAHRKSERVREKSTWRMREGLVGGRLGLVVEEGQGWGEVRGQGEGKDEFSLTKGWGVCLDCGQGRDHFARGFWFQG